ncbi:antirestriction protein ArdA [Leuconostoc citreum]|uniref:TN916 ORF18-like protein n=1 Tax=Leuconostoc citreum (strain KM20) TaxID=349519 RepID=B1N0N2_LEUCK|nr:antirestriction protein ArdA [Leuconostoc citreum]ACA83637.1 TN916 ORF18-like protein [Leuconostoc citreum KM20]
MIKFSEIKIFVGALNVPSLGQWFTLPVSPSRVTQVLTDKGAIGSGTGNEEIMISDYEAPFKIDPYESIVKLNNMVESAKRALENGVDEQTLADLYDQGLVLLDNQIDSQVENLTIIKAEDEDDLANEVISRLGGVGQLSNEDINYYFDFKKYGHDLIFGGDFTKLPHGDYVGL